MIKLDKKDWKLLYELDRDARQSYSQLARKIQSSQESVRYRVNQLIKQGVIQKFFTIVDTSKLGFSFYKILLKLHNVNQAKVDKIISYLVKNKNVCWLSTLDGSYDIGIVIKAGSIVELNQQLENLEKKFSSYINKKVFSVNIMGEYLERDYLINKERQIESKSSYTASEEKTNIDEININIIQQLTEDARISAVEIGKKLNLSPDTIIQRKKKLEKQGIIKKYNLVLNHFNLNQIHYKVLIYLNNFQPEKIQKFLDFCRSNNRIVYIIKVLGEWNYELDIEVESVEQYREIMMEITNSFSNIIQDYSSIIVRRIHKYNLHPQ